MIILHGEDTTTSYRKLSELIEKYKNRGIEVIIKDAGELDPTGLRQLTQTTDLFGSTRCLVIKNLLGGVKAKQKELFIKILSAVDDMDVILLENKKISETQLKSFPKAVVETFTINPVIFKFLDILRPGNTRVILLSWNKLLDLGHEPEYVFAMLVRQIRLLIQAKSGASYLKIPPFPKKLVISQAEHFTLNQLLDLHHDLYEMDKRIKTGQSTLPLDQLLTQFFYLI